MTTTGMTEYWQCVNCGAYVPWNSPHVCQVYPNTQETWQTTQYEPTLTSLQIQLTRIENKVDGLDDEKVIIPVGLLISCLEASAADPIILPLWVAQRLREAIPDDGARGTDLRSMLTEAMEG